VTPLVGLITSSPHPGRLADFYRLHFGIPYQLNQHGTLPAHYECDQNGIHFAIIERSGPEHPGNIVPSFQVNDLTATLAEFEREGVRPLHAVMELGGGSRVSTIPDPDGNHLRLFESH
jgi:predicted enzyme related to lactoylglutathione lyase